MGDVTSRHASTSNRRISLRFRFIVTITVILLVAFTGTAVVLLRNSRASLTKSLNQSSRSFAELATRPIGDAYDTYRASGSFRLDIEVNKFTALNDTIKNVSVTDTQGKILYSLHDRKAITADQASSFKPTAIKNSAGIYTTIVQPYFDTNGRHPYAIIYDVSTADLETAIMRSTETIVVFSIIALLITALVMYWLINRLFLKPIEAVSRTSQEISGGKYDTQVVRERNDEIGDLANSVNQMATTLKQDIFKLQEVDTMKNEFIMITSHNLRTPLTIIEGYMEIIRDSQLPNELRSMINSIEDGLRRLASFSEDILTIATIEGGKTIVKTRSTTIKDMVKGIEDTYTSAAMQEGIQFIWQLDNADTKINVSSIHMRGVIRNLLDNAIKFTHKDGSIRCTISIKGSSLIIKVEDTGIGIAAEEMDKLFQKFHRGTSTYQYNYEGTGIGLYATKLIVQAHHGHVTAASTLGKGSTFTVEIPDAVATDVKNK